MAAVAAAGSPLRGSSGCAVSGGGYGSGGGTSSASVITTNTPTRTDAGAPALSSPARVPPAISPTRSGNHPASNETEKKGNTAAKIRCPKCTLQLPCPHFSSHSRARRNGDGTSAPCRAAACPPAPFGLATAVPVAAADRAALM
ncbi:unnamed protein product [Phaeothamnion confervicola]